jgi:hypothetical protein
LLQQLTKILFLFRVELVKLFLKLSADFSGLDLCDENGRFRDGASRLAFEKKANARFPRKLAKIA